MQRHVPHVAGLAPMLRFWPRLDSASGTKAVPFTRFSVRLSLHLYRCPAARAARPEKLGESIYQLGVGCLWAEWLIFGPGAKGRTARQVENQGAVEAEANGRSH